jgi:hypothetical protein
MGRRWYEFVAARTDMPFGKTTAVALALLLLCGVAWPLVPLLAAPSESDRNAALAAIDAWPGWRGLTAEGRAERSLPTRWSADEGIRWKTPIPGRGHSSPIVFGERVYVTTAYTATSGLLLQDVLRILTLGLVLAVATLVFRFVAERCHPTRSTWADLAAGTFMVA